MTLIIGGRYTLKADLYEGNGKVRVLPKGVEIVVLDELFGVLLVLAEGREVYLLKDGLEAAL